MALASAKRVRPALVYFGYLACGGKDPESTFDLGISLELLHTFALIHDDIMDEAETRRGQPTVEVAYVDFYTSNKKRIGVKHPTLPWRRVAARSDDGGCLGNKDKLRLHSLTGAILAGDYAYMLCQEILGSSSYTKPIKELFYEMQFELIAGQLDDCLGVGQADWGSLGEDRILRMLKTKSGNYTIQKPLLLGALLAQANQRQVEVLTEIGESLGLVFQIVDDILGIFGEEEETGKSVSGDILEGKRTLLMARTFARCDDLEKEQFKQIVGNSQSTAGEIAWIKELIEQKGVLVELQKYCEGLVADFQKQISENFDEKSEGVSFLKDFADYLLHRKS